MRGQFGWFWLHLVNDNLAALLLTSDNMPPIVEKGVQPFQNLPRRKKTKSKRDRHWEMTPTNPTLGRRTRGRKNETGVQ